MKRKKRKIKKSIKIILLIIFIIFVSCLSIFIYKKTDDQPIKIKTTVLKKEKSELEKLNFSKEDIDILNKYVSKENIDYIVKNKLDNKLVMSFVNESYYIDDYFNEYLDYYNDNSNLDFKEIVTRINTHINNKFYTNVVDTDNTLGKYVLLNKFYKTDSSYKGENLVNIDEKHNLYGSSYPMKLSKECYDAFIKMYNAALKEGLEFRINSAYRSYERQVTLYNNYVKSDGVELADTYSARPGASEHQTGFAFDVRDYPMTTDDFSKTEEFIWMKENAYKYGFIIRFPEDKEYITGYQYEPWHYRYCGIDCSTYIYKHNITFEEYYEYFIKYNNPKGLK